MILISKFKRGTSSGISLAKGLAIKNYSVDRPPKRIAEPIINWGLSDLKTLEYANLKVFNLPTAIAIASNKLHSFNTLEGHEVSIPKFFTNRRDAEDYMLRDNPRMVCRTVLSGSGGKGIVIANDINELVDCRLYVEYIKKEKEFRVHVVNGKVVYIQQKRRLSTEQLQERGITDRNKYIRNLANGYIFSSNLDELHEDVIASLKHQALLSVQSLALDFGAVDLIVNKFGEVYVLEVNTAPGLEGTTLEKYIEAFNELK